MVPVVSFHFSSPRLERAFGEATFARSDGAAIQIGRAAKRRRAIAAATLGQRGEAVYLFLRAGRGERREGDGKDGQEMHLGG